MNANTMKCENDREAHTRARAQGVRENSECVCVCVLGYKRNGEEKNEWKEAGKNKSGEGERGGTHTRMDRVHTVAGTRNLNHSCRGRERDAHPHNSASK